MTLIEQECRQRGVTRLCHFTQSRNLAHMLGDCLGVLSRDTLRNDDLPHNPTDPARYDGCDELVCCSLEYPNTYYFHKVRGQDHLFRDWVVLLIAPDFLWGTGTKFCPCNAARECGAHIGDGFRAFRSLFASTYSWLPFGRPSSHLPCAPTDIQAEVLVPDPIPLDTITGIAVESDQQAERELRRLELQGLSINMPIIIAPDFYNRSSLSRSIQSGRRVQETPYT